MKESIWRGAVAGLAGGLVASWTMNRFQDVWLAFSENVTPADNERSETQGEKKEQDDATVKAASAVSEGLLNHKLTREEKKIAGPAVHYAFGTAVGGLYGAAAEVAPSVTSTAGLPFGTAFWLVADEAAVPLLGLSKPPDEYPVSTHAYAFASHLVYGLTTEIVRRSLRKAM